MKVDYWAKFEENQYYHIYNRGINGVNLFYKPENYRYFLEKWMFYIHPFMRTYAYCLMPNHFHFIASPNPSAIVGFDTDKNHERTVLCQRVTKTKEKQISINEFLELQFKDFFGAYSKAVNKQENRTGSLFQQRFKRVLLLDEYALATKICYTHHNPIHHGFCEHYEEWLFSSYLRFLTDKESILEKDFVRDLFYKMYQFSEVEDSNVITQSKVTDTSKVSVTYASSFYQLTHEKYRLKPPKNYDEV